MVEGCSPQYSVERCVDPTVGLMVCEELLLMAILQTQHNRIALHSGPYAIQQDNARLHVARVSLDYLEHNESIILLPWPLRSAYLSSIEYVRSIMGRTLTNLPQPP